ncbi:MAG: hypothetical protein QM528_03585 [Phycisphaerales bacterium]|nr:hypothetical protein [Phycisphaerales bacterium]
MVNSALKLGSNLKRSELKSINGGDHCFGETGSSCQICPSSGFDGTCSNGNKLFNITVSPAVQSVGDALRALNAGCEHSFGCSGHCVTDCCWTS